MTADRAVWPLAASPTLFEFGLPVDRSWFERPAFIALNPLARRSSS